MLKCEQFFSIYCPSPFTASEEFEHCADKARAFRVHSTSFKIYCARASSPLTRTKHIQTVRTSRMNGIHAEITLNRIALNGNKVVRHTDIRSNAASILNAHACARARLDPRRLFCFVRLKFMCMDVTNIV